MAGHENVIEAVYPLSPAQEGILFDTLLSEDRGTYTVQRLSTLPDDLDIALLKDAWRQVIQYHTILRTAFLFESVEKPLQIVGRQVQLPWEEDDWRMIPTGIEQEELDTLLRADRAQGFELTHAPLMRFRLLHRHDGSYYFLWSFHHVILDGWSSPLVLKQVYTCYARAQQGQPTHFPAAQPYQMYITWLQRQDLRAAERFWRMYLQGIAAPTLLVQYPQPFRAQAKSQISIFPQSDSQLDQGKPRISNSFVSDESQGETEEVRYGRCRLQLATSLVEALETLLQHYHLTVNTVLLGAWALLLNRYSGEMDVIFGTAVSGRPPTLPGIEEMVGMFLNTLPVRVRVVESQAAHSWLQELQQQQAEMRQYEYSPLVQIQKWCDVPRGTPLFQNILICGAPALVTEQEIWLETEEAQATESTNYPLAINVEPGRPFLIQATYETDHFTEKTVQCILTHLQTILEQMSERPAQNVGNIDILSGAERRQLLREWNTTRREYSANVSIAEIFAEQVARSPNEVAVIYEGARLTYQELEQKANQLAHYLRKRGVGPEVLVALCSERSLEMLVGLIGILKAGGAYVPLDPSYPRERLAFILTDAVCSLVLTQHVLIERLPLEGKAQAICLDRDWEMIEQESVGALDKMGDPANLAYVIYTSGSTGKPKGVQIPQRAVINFLQSMREQLHIDHTDTWLAVTTISFDIAVLELFLPLIVGARVVLASHEVAADGYQLVQLLLNENATVMQATPATWRMLLSDGWSGKYDLKVLCGGEALASDLAHQLVPICQELWNLYGPTETTIWSTATRISDGAITLGRPIANTEAYVLDAALRPVPVGVEGQLYLGGLGLARGYLKRPELTAERFIPDPFGQELGGRLYQTGDRVRYRADGRLEFLGRIDYQVKVRGFRIELGEIETVLRKHTLICDAAAVVQEDTDEHKRIIAYVVMAASEEVGGMVLVQEVQDFLRQQLPGYMVPSLVVRLEALPLTPNGKVDRRALPRPEALAQQKEDAYVRPSSAIEQTLAEIWQQVLCVERVGIHDPFFALGGDSILSVRIGARARQAGFHLTPRDLFQHQTIAELARLIEQTSGAKPEQYEEHDPIAVPLTPIQHWFFERHLPNYHYWNQSFLFQAKEHLDPALLRLSLQILIEAHAALRLRFRQEEHQWKQVYASAKGESDVPLTILDCPEGTRETQNVWIQERISEFQKSLRLDKGPLLHVALFNVGLAQPQRLFFVIHHLAVDLTSWNILLQDWRNIYRQVQAKLPVQPPVVATPFPVWAQRLETYAHSLRLMRERTYWLTRPWSQIKSLPVDIPGGENTERWARTLSATLDRQETSALLQEVARAYHLLAHEVLLVALAEMVACWTGSRALLVELEGHGREDIIEDVDLSRTVGWFTALAPFCLDLRNQKTMKEALIAVKEQIRAMPNGGIGYGLLRYCSKDEGVRLDLAALPRSEIVFHYRGQSATVLERNALLSPTEEMNGLDLHPDSPRSHLLAFEGQIIDDHLRIALTYSERCFTATTIARLLGWCLEALKSIIAHCQMQREEQFTPQDFPEADLEQSELDSVLASLYDEMESR
jgi:amino acid adenylation domain-containing protein/non-ribosomal peptide synthase protein (TIGR01720 family)